MFSRLMSSGTAMLQMHPVMAGLATICALIAVAILVWFLIRRPSVQANTTRIALLLGMGVFPISAAALGNLVSYEHSMHREFCGSCHVMIPWTSDSSNPKSQTLAARHARNARFGDENCYTCHEDYGMFGTLVTKLGGMRHVWEYYTHYRTYTQKEAVQKIHILKPFSNEACMNCHSTEVKEWLDVDEHRSLLAEIRSGEASCASSGCHGPAHPFSPQSRKSASPPPKPKAEPAPEAP